MFTIVDFHQDIYAAVLCGDGFPAWTLPGPHPAPHHDCPGWGGKYLDDPAVRAAFDAFWADGSPARAAYEKLWDRMVARYRDRPGVIGFEPFNEPAPGTADPDLWAATTLTTFYTEIGARIRKAAPTSLVFVDGSGVDSVVVATSLTRPEGEGFVFAPHYYQPSALNDLTPNPEGVRSALLRWANVGKKWNVPVLLGEFDATNATPDARLAQAGSALHARVLRRDRGRAPRPRVPRRLRRGHHRRLLRSLNPRSAAGAGERRRRDRQGDGHGALKAGVRVKHAAGPGEPRSGADATERRCSSPAEPYPHPPAATCRSSRGRRSRRRSEPPGR